MTIKRGVSLYSFQEEYFLRTMSLEDCIAAAARIGANGIEIIPEQSIPGYPHLSDEFIQTWHGWMKTYGTTPVATDLFLDTKRHPDRWLTTRGKRFTYVPMSGMKPRAGDPVRSMTSRCRRIHGCV